MLDENDAWLMEEDIALDDSADLLLTMPEIRQLVDPARPDEQLGLRSILERPETLSKAWRHCANAERHQGLSKVIERADVLRAA
jgi:hypothetical protein